MRPGSSMSAPIGTLGVGAYQLRVQLNDTALKRGDARYSSASAGSVLAPDLRSATSWGVGPRLVRSSAIFRRHATFEMGCGCGAALATAGARTAAARTMATVEVVFIMFLSLRASCRALRRWARPSRTGTDPLPPP